MPLFSPDHDVSAASLHHKPRRWWHRRVHRDRLRAILLRIDYELVRVGSRHDDASVVRAAMLTWDDGSSAVMVRVLDRIAAGVPLGAALAAETVLADRQICNDRRIRGGPSALLIEAATTVDVDKLKRWAVHEDVRLRRSVLANRGCPDVVRAVAALGC